MAIKNLMAAEQTKREGNFLKLFSSRNFNRSTSARLPITSTCKQFHRFVEPKAVYSIDPVDEVTARAKAERIQYKPIDKWDIRPMLEDVVKKADAASLLKMRPDLVQRVLPEQTAESAPAGEIMNVQYEELEIGYQYKTKGGWIAVVESACEDFYGEFWVCHKLPDGSIKEMLHDGNGVPSPNEGKIYLENEIIDLSTKKPIEEND